MPPLTRKQKKINALKAKRRSPRLNQLPPEKESKDEDKSEEESSNDVYDNSDKSVSDAHNEENISSADEERVPGDKEESVLSSHQQETDRIDEDVTEDEVLSGAMEDDDEIQEDDDESQSMQLSISDDSESSYEQDVEILDSLHRPACKLSFNAYRDGNTIQINNLRTGMLHIARAVLLFCGGGLSLERDMICKAAKFYSFFISFVSVLITNSTHLQLLHSLQETFHSPQAIVDKMKTYAQLGSGNNEKFSLKEL